MGKRLKSMLLGAACAAAALAGCSSGEAPGEEIDETAAVMEETGAPGVEGLEIGVCIYHKDDAFMKLYQEELADYLEAGGASVEVMDGKDDQEEQTSQIDNFITRGIDVLIINLVQTSAAEQVTDKGAAAGVPVVVIAREPSPAEEYRWETEGIAAAYVGADAAQTGRCQGEIILELPDRGDVNGDGKVSYVLIQGDMENPDAQFRSEYAVRSLTDAGMEAEELYKQSGLWEEKEGRRIAEEALEAYGDRVEVIFCGNDEMALGALEAIEDAGRTVGEDIYLVGVDALEEALECVAQGSMTGTVFQDHIGQSHLAAELAGRLAAGEDASAVNTVDCIRVTQENAADIRTLL